MEDKLKWNGWVRPLKSCILICSKFEDKLNKVGCFNTCFVCPVPKINDFDGKSKCIVADRFTVWRFNWETAKQVLNLLKYNTDIFAAFGSFL